MLINLVFFFVSYSRLFKTFWCGSVLCYEYHIKLNDILYQTVLSKMQPNDNTFRHESTNNWFVVIRCKYIQFQIMFISGENSWCYTLRLIDVFLSSYNNWLYHLTHKTWLLNKAEKYCSRQGEVNYFLTDSLLFQNDNEDDVQAAAVRHKAYKSKEGKRKS